MAILDNMVFQDFFGRKSNADCPLTASLDREAYSKLYNRYEASLGWGSIPTEKGFEKWLNKNIKKVSNGK